MVKYRPRRVSATTGVNKMKSRFLLLGMLLGVLASAPAMAATWITSWAAAPLPPSPAAGPFSATPAFSNQTIRQTLRLSAGGSRLRLRLSNEYGTKPLTIGAAVVTLANADGSPKTGAMRVITFGGASSAVIAAGAPLLSDPIDLPTGPLATIQVNLYLPEDTGPCTCHATGMQDAQVSGAGDFTRSDFTPAQTIQSRAFLSGVEVEARRGGTIVMLGDSITDGMGSTLNANRRWPDQLAARLNRGGASWGVANLGISGNRVLEDGAGVSALARFDRDVLAVSGATHVVIFEGVNDLGISFGRAEGPMAERMRALMPRNKATAERIIAGYQQLIARGHAMGLKVYGATVAPYEGASYWSAKGETQRQAINQWIRTSGAFDGVLDFDAVLRDPAQPSRMRANFHAGDWLHGSDAGYEAMARSIDTGLFRTR
jgi:lysophospholipase L1-like esterase